jgi:hypothetical protein
MLGFVFEELPSLLWTQEKVSIHIKVSSRISRKSMFKDLEECIFL